MSEVVDPRTSRRDGSVSKVIVVLPVFNEAAALPGLCSSLDALFSDLTASYRIVAVDDGSSDGSADLLDALAADLPVTVIRHEETRGLGATIRDGLRVAATMAVPADVIITMDADETHTPDHIREMLRALEAGPDVVIASRFRPGAKVTGVPVFRKVLSFGASKLMSAAFPTDGVRDYTCGYRAYRAATLQTAIDDYGEDFVRSDGFQCMVDILLQLRKRGARFAEIPFTLRYDMKKGKSKMKVMKTVLATLSLIVRRRWRE